MKRAIDVHNCIVQCGIGMPPYIKVYNYIIKSIKLTWIKELAINTEMTKWQKLLQFLHLEPEVVTDYGPKLLTN